VRCDSSAQARRRFAGLEVRSRICHCSSDGNPGEIIGNTEVNRRKRRFFKGKCCRPLGNQRGRDRSCMLLWSMSFPIDSHAKAYVCRHVFNGSYPVSQVSKSRPGAPSDSGRTLFLEIWSTRQRAVKCSQPYAGDYTFGNEPRVDNEVRANGIKNWDFAVQKSTPLHETISLDFPVRFNSACGRITNPLWGGVHAAPPQIQRHSI
jgi:hypothetical protein